MQAAGDSIVVFYPDLSFLAPAQISVSVPAASATTGSGLELRFYDPYLQTWNLPYGQSTISRYSGGRAVVTAETMHLSQWAVCLFFRP